MPEALSSFLVSVGIIVSIILVVPCIESIANLLRRNAPGAPSLSHGEASKVFSREVA